MATKKPAVKAAAKKPVSKKVAAPAKKTAASVKKVVAAKKVVAPAKKVIAVAKKVAPAKKIATKPAAKSIPKKIIKPAVKEVKKAAVKPVAKKVVAAKTQTKPLTKKIETKKPTATTQPAKAIVKEVVIPKVTEKVVPKTVIAKPEVKKPLVLPKINTKTSRKYEPDFTKSVLDKAVVDRGAEIVMYSDADLAEFKELIQRKLGSAKKELAYLQGLLTRKDDLGGDEGDGRYMTMEDGSLSMEREQLSQMASRQITFVDHLEKALMRIENKTYGVCRVTGKLIDKARLRAVPHATLSIEAKMGSNK
jgi:RNA polymerase-binding transcription factor DksA